VEDKNGWKLLETEACAISDYPETNPPLQYHNIHIEHTCGHKDVVRGLLEDAWVIPVRYLGLTASTSGVTWQPQIIDEVARAKAAKAKTDKELEHYSTPKLYEAHKWWETKCYECSKCPTCGHSPQDDDR
jgi:hypothetical protein